MSFVLHESKTIFALDDSDTDLNAVVQHVVTTHEAAVLVDKGQEVVILQTAAAYQQAAEERAFMLAVIKGLDDITTGRTVSLQEAKQRFGLG